VLLPRGSRVGDDAWQVSTPGRLGDDCRLHGNVRAESLVVGRDNEIFGSLRAREGITVGSGTEVAGNVTTRNGTVRIGPDTEIRGDISGEFVEVHHEATIEGAIRAREETSMVSDPVIDDAVVDDGAGSTGTDEPDATEDAGSETSGDEAETASSTPETETETETETGSATGEEGAIDRQ
jgi:cytoskeletal protein CcmA (bactofilin family)